MHEYGITQDIIRAAVDAAAKAGAKRVTSVKLVIGDLASVVDSSVRFYFDILAEGTPVAGAELVFERVPAELMCQACGKVFPLAGRDWTCPDCGGAARITDRAREFYVESIEVE